MDFFIILCLIGLLSIVTTTIVKLCTLKRAEKLSYLKNFKKGKFALMYLAAIPLYWIGIYHSGTPAGWALLMAIKSCIDLVFLKYDFSSINLLVSQNALYSVTMYICFVLVALNAALFSLTLVGQNMYNLYRKSRTVRFSKKIFIIVGFNKQTEAIAKSITNKSDVILLTQDNENAADFAFIQKLSYIKTGKDGISEILPRLFKSYDDKIVNVIINTGCDSKNLIFADQVSKIIADTGLEKYSIDDRRGLNAYVFGEPENATAFLHYIEKTKGCIHYVNKYRLIAIDFVGKYPITEYMSHNEIDYPTATIKDDVDINVAMIGFGKTNQQIFLTSVASNQLISKKDNKIVDNPINYWIYDKKDACSDKNLNHNYYRYSKEVTGDISQYLPLPPKPANEAFFGLDINKSAFYDSLRQNITPSAGGKAYNYIVIAFGTDMENLDFAYKITVKLKEWGVYACTKVFVKIRDAAISDTLSTDTASQQGFVSFGNESTIVYNIAKIIEEDKEVMARNKHLSYALSAAAAVKDEQSAKANALKTWFALSQVQRESNIYACLSIRLKLHLLGYDYRPIDDSLDSANQDYQQDYERGDPIIFDDSQPIIKGRRIVKHGKDFVKGSVRDTLAIQEHQRWNAYMIANGFIPSTIQQIQAGQNKDMEQRRHGNLTTYDGLIEFRKIIADTFNISQTQADVIKYDYQIMDDLVWTLTNSGYKIVKKH